MAVKQNNTETNGAATTVGSSAGTTTTGGSTKANASSGGGTKTKKMNPNGSDVTGNSGNSNADPPVCSGANSTGASAKAKLSGSVGNSLPSAGIGNGGGGVGGGGGGGIGGGSNNNHNINSANIMQQKPGDISRLLHLIEVVEMEPRVVMYELDMRKIYQILINELARVQVSCQTPEEMKRFKEDIAKVGTYFAKEKRMYPLYLRMVCHLITQSDAEPPSCAIAVIFQLFNAELVVDAVQSLLAMKISDENIRKTVRLLSEWLRMCNFCQNLNLWILAILNGLHEQRKITLFEEIALENIDQLFVSIIVPVLRPKVAPIVFLMLSSITHTPEVFHKILHKFPKVLSFLKKQANSSEDDAEETKKFIHQLVDMISDLMVRFNDYSALYEPIENVLKDFRPSYSYRNYMSGSKGDEGSFGLDVALHNTNAKVGLVNLGNTCYMNSVLQALAMTKEFSREILLSESKSPLVVKMQQQIALMLYSRRYELTPSRVLNATRPPGFSPGLQQDSSEFLGYLLETLHEQEMSFRKHFGGGVSGGGGVGGGSERDVEPIAKTSKPNVDTAVHSPATEGATALTDETNQTTSSSSIDSNNGSNIIGIRHVDSSTNQHSTTSSSALTTKATVSTVTSLALSTIEKTFTGKLATTYKCLTCGWKSRNIDSFRDLQLSFPEVKSDCASNYSVQDLIDYYCSPEKLDGDNQYFCERCKKLSDAERYINVISAPKNLILTLKHFKYDQKYHMRAKLMHKVFHDEKVSVKVCTPETLDEIASVHYDLYAGVVHSGFSMDSGHYYTYASDATNKWYKFNDSIVTVSRSEELHNLAPPNTPYILFYQMGARSSETPEACASNKVVKVDVPNPLLLEELPNDLQEYVNHDNSVFTEELKLRHFKNANAAALQNALKGNGSNNGGGGGGGGGRNGYDDDDDQPPTSGCGGNAMNINVNRFVY